MKNIYKHNNNTVKVGDSITIGSDQYEIRELNSDLVKFDRDLPDGYRIDGYYTKWAYTHAVGIERILLPKWAVYNRETGMRVHSGELVPGGAVIFLDTNPTVPDIYADFGDGAGQKYVGSAVGLADLGLEVRYKITEDMLEAVPRSVRFGVPRVRVGRRYVPAKDAVWCRLEGKYILAERAVPVGTEWVDKSCPELIEFVGGGFGLRGGGYPITAGSLSGKYVMTRRERAQIGGHYYHLSEVVSVWGRNYREPVRFLLEEPIDNAHYELVSGFWCEAGTPVTLLSGIRYPFHLSSEVRVVTDEGSWLPKYVPSRELESVARCCEECGYWYLMDSMRGSECLLCSEYSRTRIRSYHSRSADLLTPEEDVPIKFGIELEVGTDRGYDTTECTKVMADCLSQGGRDFAEYGVFKHDGSIECGGFEVVTRPDSPAVHKRIWSAALSDPTVRTHMSSWSNGHCGMHIHVSRAPLSPLWIGRILVMISSCDMERLVVAVAGRDSTSYAIRRSKTLLSGKDKYGDRYEAVNTTGSKTIEFRIFRGTLDHDGFLRNIEFVEAILSYTRPASTSLGAIGLIGPFLDFVSKRRKDYPNLFAFLLRKGFLPPAIDRRKTT